VSCFPTHVGVIISTPSMTSCGADLAHLTTDLFLCGRTRTCLAITLGLFILNATASLFSLALEVTLWNAEWGKLHAAAFLLLAAAFGCYRLSRVIYRHRTR
jgi:hypothetical protein